MGKLTAKQRKTFPKGDFGLPAERKYPMPDVSHAVNAKARASQQVGKSITRGQEQRIDAKANRIIKGKRGA